MFVPVNHDRCMWFNKDCSWSSSLEHSLVGLLFGLAMYNNIIIDVQLPLVLFKKLLRRAIDISDLFDVDPQLYSGLMSLLTFEPSSDVEYIFCRTFEVTYDSFNTTKKIELIPDGSSISVTGFNRSLYVEKFVQWLLVDSVAKQFDDFYKGFSRVISPDAIELFFPEELDQLVCGSREFNFLELERTCQYVGGSDQDGWSREYPTINWFWEIMNEFSVEDKQNFLFFVTGSKKAPLGGLANVNLIIQRMGSDSEQLPTTHTCFNTLLLPAYDNKEKLRSKLLQAIHETEGFGLR
jgi:ubiquitin-protein ligase E3 A